MLLKVMMSKNILKFFTKQGLLKVSSRYESTKLSKPRLKFGKNDPSRQITFGEYCLLVRCQKLLKNVSYKLQYISMTFVQFISGFHEM